jgi:DNA invertase Pin-like site-specific DNA recombinase
MVIKKKDKVQLGTLEEGNGAPAGSGVAYLRVSTSGQEEGTSLDVQREKVFALSSVLGVAIAPHHIISEVGSGADPDRRGLLTVWNLVERKEVQHVFAYDTDRLARDPWHVLQLVRHCKDHGVALHFAEDYQ